jgi:hypothetical protein
MSLGTTVEWLGGILICNWYLERFSISKFNKNTSITKYNLLVQGLNHNWLNPLQHGYICKTYLSIRVHKIEPMHTSFTINMHQRIKNLLLNGEFTNCQG